MQIEENPLAEEPLKLCPQCGKGSLILKATKSYSYIDIVGSSVLILFISGLLYSGIFGRYSVAMLLVEIYIIIKVLPKLVNYKIITKLSCVHCGYSIDEHI